MFCPPRLSPEVEARFPVPTASPPGPRTQVALPSGIPWARLPPMPVAVPCVVEWGPCWRQTAQTQPTLVGLKGQKKPPRGNTHHRRPAPGRGASGQCHRQGRPLDCGTWQPRPQRQPCQPVPTSLQFPWCLTRQPLCTTHPQHLPQPDQPQSGPPRPPPGQPGGTGAPSSLTWTTWRSSARP